MGEEIENTQEQTLEQKSSVEVTRNSKGYNWKVKVYDIDSDIAFAKMVALESECLRKYGDKPKE